MSITWQAVNDRKIYSVTCIGNVDQASPRGPANLQNSSQASGHPTISPFPASPNSVPADYITIDSGTQRAHLYEWTAGGSTTRLWRADNTSLGDNLSAAAGYNYSTGIFALGYTSSVSGSDYAYCAVAYKSKYRVVFNLDGKGTRTGGGALVQNVDYQGAATAPTVEGNPGWLFTGWDSSFNNVTSNITVTAQYIRTYTVTFNLDGKGTRTGGGALVQVVQEGQAAVAPTVVGNTGWSFTGWDVAFDNITSDLTVTAQYNMVTFTVTFDLAGKGTRTGGGDLIQVVQEGQAAVAPVVVGNTGWAFTGWDVAFDNITSDLTVTAQYDMVTFTVTFDLDGKGTRTGGGDLIQVVQEGQAAVAPVVVGNTGWVFTGWDVAFDNITSDLTVTAQYDAVVEGEGEPEGELEGEPEGEGEPPVEFQVNPVGETYFERRSGSSVTFKVEVSGSVGNVSYQWYRITDTKGLSVIPGAEQDTYVIPSITADDAGEYLCEVSDDVLEETVFSPIFTLVVFSGVPVAGLLGVGIASIVTMIAAASALRKRR